MKSKLNLRRGAAILACAASLAGTVAIAPSAASAEAGTPCANKVFAIANGGPTDHIPVKAITVEGGVTCADAYKLIRDTLSGKEPSGWKSVLGKFEAPEGLIPSELKKGAKKVRYAVRGG
ncbi:MAG TPA: hypothetical protein VMF55_07675 [Solirubrobacterales bacterium]|nr:hypothetical protein [Solirubrobacterales bacterium]